MNDDKFDENNAVPSVPKRDVNAVAGSNGAPPSDRPELPPAPPVAELKFDRNNFLAAAAYLDRNMAGLIEYQRALARLSRERFIALVTVGFSEAQALELVKTPLF